MLQDALPVPLAAAAATPAGRAAKRASKPTAALPHSPARRLATSLPPAAALAAATFPPSEPSS